MSVATTQILQGIQTDEGGGARPAAGASVGKDDKRGE